VTNKINLTFAQF